MFAHLHMHTEYSLLDGASRIEPLLDKIQALGMTHCAITDHGAMYGVVDFLSAGIKAQHPSRHRLRGLYLPRSDRQDVGRARLQPSDTAVRKPEGL